MDEDDLESHHLDHPDIRIDRTIGPRLTMGGYNSWCLEQPQGEIIILVNDNMVIRTRGWDEEIWSFHEKCRGGIYLAYGNDLFTGDRLCAFPILSRRTCDLLGEPYPAAYGGAFIDYHLFDIFKRLQHVGHDRIRYLEEVIFEHLHYLTGKVVIDETYTQRGRFNDDSTFMELEFYLILILKNQSVILEYRADTVVINQETVVDKFKVIAGPVVGRNPLFNPCSPTSLSAGEGA